MSTPVADPAASHASHGCTLSGRAYPIVKRRVLTPGPDGILEFVVECPLIARHAHYTNSAKAKRILENWADYQPKFKKVMPVEYRRALAEIAKHQAEYGTGLEVLEIGLPTSAKG